MGPFMSIPEFPGLDNITPHMVPTILSLCHGINSTISAVVSPIFLRCVAPRPRRPGAKFSPFRPRHPAVGVPDIEAARAASAASKADYRIGPTDLIEVTVFQQADLGRQLRITQNGTITLPLIGMVNVGGHTLN